MLALTVKQPWAHAIIHCGKDIENRNWPTNHRGPLLIHAGLSYDRDGEQLLASLGHDMAIDMPAGFVIGVVDVIDCTHTFSPSRWAEPDCWHWRLANARAVQPYRCRGQLGLFTAPEPRLYSHDEGDMM
jgi:hypothetical protein